MAVMEQAGRAPGVLSSGWTSAGQRVAPFLKKGFN